MNALPQVTVGLPVYNSAATMRHTIASVQAQTYEDWELVLVCNGCTDDSIELARRAAHADPRIRVDVLEHASVVAASNRILELG